MNTISLGFTPDPDDATSVYALAAGHVAARDFRVRLVPGPIEELNRLTARGALDAAAISSVHYPAIQDEYAVLRVGASVGRGYGPALVARAPVTLAGLAGARIAVPGLTTTGATLLRLFVADFEAVPMPFEHVRRAVLGGAVDAGVLIHEELLSWTDSGLHRVACLGATWRDATGLPLPVGLNVMRRDLPPRIARAFPGLLRDSIELALEHPEEAFTWARRFARSPTAARARVFADMFTNSDTLWLPEDCERGLRELFDRLAERGLARRVSDIEIVDPAPAAAPRVWLSHPVAD